MNENNLQKIFNDLYEKVRKNEELPKWVTNHFFRETVKNQIEELSLKKNDGKVPHFKDGWVVNPFLNLDDISLKIEGDYAIEFKQPFVRRFSLREIQRKVNKKV